MNLPNSSFFSLHFSQNACHIRYLPDPCRSHPALAQTMAFAGVMVLVIYRQYHRYLGRLYVSCDSSRSNGLSYLSLDIVLFGNHHGVVHYYVFIISLLLKYEWAPSNNSKSRSENSLYSKSRLQCLCMRISLCIKLILYRTSFL